MSNHKAVTAVRTLKRGVGRTLLAALLLATTVALVPAVAADAAASPIRVTGAGDLIVTGTNNPRDEISISQEAPDSFRILVNTAGDIAEYNVEDVTRNVTFNMRGGDDIITIFGHVWFPRDLTIRWGSGRSILRTESLPHVAVYGNFTMLDGSGLTVLDLNEFHVQGRTRLTLGGGEAHLSVSNSEFRDDFTVSTSSAGWFEQADFEQVTFRDRFSLNGGNKSDKFKATETNFVGVTKFSFRGGDDHLELSQTPLRGAATISMGSGDDYAKLQVVPAYDRFNFKADGGDDHLTILANTFYKASTINGGGGTDSLFEGGNTFHASSRILSF